MKQFADTVRTTFFGLVLFFLISPGFVYSATPTATSASPNSTQVGIFTKFEVGLTISKKYIADSFLPYYYYDASDTLAVFPNCRSPYGVDGITINAIFTAPSDKQLTVPAFYFQDYVRSGSLSREVMTPSSNYSWKVRFVPEETRNYSYYIT